MASYPLPSSLSWVNRYHEEQRKLQSEWKAEQERIHEKNAKKLAEEKVARDLAIKARRDEAERQRREKAAGERLELERVKQEIERDEKLAAQRVVAEKVRLERIMVENVKERKIREAAKLKQWEEDQKMMREYKEKVREYPAPLPQLPSPPLSRPLTTPLTPPDVAFSCWKINSLTEKRSSGKTPLRTGQISSRRWARSLRKRVPARKWLPSLQQSKRSFSGSTKPRCRQTSRARSVTWRRRRWVHVPVCLPPCLRACLLRSCPQPR